MGNTESVLGFDYGVWRIGVATGQRLIASATPLTTLHNRNREQIDWPTVLSHIDQRKPDSLVVGWPIDDAGDCYPVAAAVRRFAARLHEQSGLPVWLVDERLSSEQAKTRLGVKITRQAPEHIDAGAAAIIIEQYFQTKQPIALSNISKRAVQQSIQRHQQRNHNH